MAKINNNTCEDLAQSLIITQQTNWQELTSDLVTYTEKVNKLAVQLADERPLANHNCYRSLIGKLMIAEKRAMAAEDAKADFLDNMRHDFRTPLSNIVGLSELLLKSKSDEQKKQYIDIIVNSGKQLLYFLTEILEFDNIDSGQRFLHFTRIDLKEIIDDVSAIIFVGIKNKKLKFFVDIKKDIPKSIIGDKFRVKMILLNLLSNAVKFTEKGHIRISAEINSHQKNQLRLKVEDTGIGIPKERYTFIFEKFTRLSPTYKGLYEGAGLGLYMVDKFIKELAGKITLKSEVGKGTTFDVAIPFELT